MIEEINELWDWLEDMNIATEEELRLITNINGHSLKTLNDVLLARTGYHDREQYKKNNGRSKENEIS